MHKPCFPCSFALLAAITLTVLSGCDRETKPVGTTQPVVSGGPPTKLSQFPEDLGKIAALEAAGFTLTRNSDGLVTEISVVSNQSPKFCPI